MDIKEKINNNFSLIIVYILISTILTSMFNGFENISPFNTKWLFYGNDMSSHQTGWFFFKNDIWRFPLGSNPNFGDQIGNSIIYSDSIPLFAIFFKLFNFMLPDKFQYFSFWFIICFFLQGFLSFLLTLKLTKNKIISFLTSLFFLSFPIFIYRLSWHPALFAHWTLIITIYLTIFDSKKNYKLWIFLILLTSMIHFYFTIINLIVFNMLKIFYLIKKEIFLKRYFKEIVLCHFLLILLMYIVGYFEVRVVDTLAVGFGIYKLNLLSIFDPVISPTKISWSWVLPDILLARGEEVEGFNFIGLGGLILLCFTIYTIFIDKNLRKLSSKKFLIRGIPFILLVFLILSLSNKISLGALDIIEIPLNDFIYGFFSIFRSSGRLFWFISYFFLLYSIYLIFLKFKSRAPFILAVLLLIQLTDISSSIKYYKDRFNFADKYELKDSLWNNSNITNLKYLISTKPVNYNKNFDKFAYHLENNNFQKTNLVKMARIDRSKAAQNRYKLTNIFVKKNLDNDSIYIIDNLGHLLNLKEIYENDDVGFFFRDNVWIMINKKKNLMNDNDINYLKNIKYQSIDLNQKFENLNDESSKFFGLGWTHNSGGDGVWTEGKISNLVFKLNKKSNELYFEFECIPFLNSKNNSSVEVYINGKFNNNINFDYKDGSLQDKRLVKFKINNKNIKGKTLNIQFRNTNPSSPLSLFLSPDSRELGFLLLNFRLLNGGV